MLGTAVEGDLVRLLSGWEDFLGLVTLLDREDLIGFCLMLSIFSSLHIFRLREGNDLPAAAMLTGP